MKYKDIAEEMGISTERSAGSCTTPASSRRRRIRSLMPADQAVPVAAVP